MASNGAIDKIVAFIGNFDPCFYRQFGHFGMAGRTPPRAGVAAISAPTGCAHRARSLPCALQLAAVLRSPGEAESECVRPVGYIAEMKGY